MNYLAIITRSDFTNLYKFGHIHLHNLVPFDGNLEDHIKDESLFDAVTKYIDTYEYSTEYLLLHINKVVFTESIVEINIYDVKAVYALSEEAKRSLQVSVDSRINLKISMWESMFADLNIKQAIRQAKIGLNNCWDIFGITPNEASDINKILPKDLVEEVYHDVFNNVRPSDNASLWNYLMRYERHEPYWNDKRGFFLDAVHVYESYRQRHEIDYGIADELPIGDTISACPNAFTTILNALNEKGENDYIIPNCNYLVVAPLFLYLKAEFKECGITPSKFEENRDLFASLHENYGLDFGIAISLLGLSLGQDLTYNYAYQHNCIGIFGATKENIIAKDVTIEPNPSKEKQPSVEDSQNIIDNQDEEIHRPHQRISELEDGQVQTPYSVLSDPVPGTESMPSECFDSVIVDTSTPVSEEYKFPDVADKQSIIQEDLGAGNNLSDNSVISVEESYTPVEMFKLNKDRTSFDKRAKQSKWAHSEEEYRMLCNKGFAPRNFFDNHTPMFTNL